MCTTTIRSVGIVALAVEEVLRSPVANVVLVIQRFVMYINLTEQSRSELYLLAFVTVNRFSKRLYITDKRGLTLLVCLM